MKILITGARGFIGQHVFRMLEQAGHSIAILSRDKKNCQLFEKPNVNLIEGSLNSIEQIKKEILAFQPTVCLHLAWEAIPDYSYKTSTQNLLSSIQLIDFLVEQTSCQKIIAAGSCFEYGKSTGEVFENSSEENALPIAWAKNSLKDYFKLRCQEKKIDWLWLRVFYVFGPGQREQSLIPSLIQTALSKQPNPIQNPQNANDFVYIDDVAKAFFIACTQSAESGIYNIGNGHLFKVTEIWKIVSQKLVEKGISLPTFEQTQQQTNVQSAIGCYANIDKAKKLLNWIPQTSVENGIEKFIEYRLKQEVL